jgi:Zn-dependent M28 family amino/carboxypeptidase
MFKKILISLSTLIALIYLGLFVFLRNPVFENTNSVNLASSQNLETHLNHIVTNFTPRSYKNFDNLSATAEYIKSTLEAYGYSPIVQDVKVKDDIRPGYKARDEFKQYDDLRGKVEANTYKNIIVKLGPTDASKMIIGAHYDVAHELPGADDNTSGTVGLLELARILKLNEAKLTNQVELVFYTLEEPPYFRSKSMGSYYHSQLVKNDKIKLMISIEMIGYYSNKKNSQDFPLSFLKHFFSDQGNFITLIGKVNDWGMTRKVKSLFIQSSPLKVFSLNAPANLVGIDFSDQLNYWNEGLPALMITDTAFYRNKQYHKPGDTPDRLNYKKMAQVVDGLYNIVLNY